jgi:hypothetical protein
MKRILLASLALCLATPVLADSRAEMDNVATCLVFGYVRNGLDGKKEIPPDLVPGLAAFWDEFSFRASTNQLSEEDAQKLVVNKLVEMNTFKAEHGVTALEEKYGTLCQNIAGTLKVKP